MGAVDPGTVPPRAGGVTTPAILISQPRARPRRRYRDCNPVVWPPPPLRRCQGVVSQTRHELADDRGTFALYTLTLCELHRTDEAVRLKLVGFLPW